MSRVFDLPFSQWGLQTLILNLSLMFVSLEASTQENMRKCELELMRLAALDPTEGFDIQNQEFSIREHLENEPIQGQDSLADYYLFGKVNYHPQQGLYLDFSYAPLTSTEDPLNPSVELYPRRFSQDKRHDLFLGLYRNSEGQWLDLNLIEKPFQHLFLNADREDQFVIPIQDSSLIELFNSHLNAFLDEIDFQFSRPRRAVLASGDLPNVKNYQWDEFRDSFFPGLPKAEIENLAMRIRNDAELLERSREQFRAHPFYQHLMASGLWDLKLEVRFFNLEFGDEEEWEDLKDDPYRMVPGLMRYEVVISPVW